MNKIGLQKAVLIPVAAPSNASICGTSFSGIAGSNPAGHMTVSCEYYVFFQAEISATGRLHVQKSPTECDVHERDGGNL